MSKQTDLINIPDAITVDGSGLVGIGTSSPSSLLTIHGSQPIITLSDSDTGSTSTISGNSGHLILNADSGSDASNNTIDFQIDNSQKMRIDSSGRVGIGTSSLGGGRGLTVANGAVAVTSANLSHSASSIVLGQNSTTVSQIRFYGADNSTAGILTFDGSSANGSAGGERMRIDASGNLLVGGTTTTPHTNTTTPSSALMADGEIRVATQNSSSLELNRTSSDGNIINLRKSGTEIGNIGTNGSTLYIGSTEGADAYLGFGNQIIRPVTSSGASRDNAIDLGYNGMRFRDAYLSGGVYLGGTGSANKLEDYEEGTHQTVATMTTSGTVTLNTSFDRISYTKVGRLVTIIGNPRILTVSSPVGQLKFTLPFTAKSGQTDECRAGFIVYYYDNTAGSGSYTKQVNATVNEGTNVVKLDLTNSHNNNITAGSSDEVLFSFSYITA